MSLGKMKTCLPSMESLYAASETKQPLICHLSPLRESLNFSICYHVLDSVAPFYTERHEGLERLGPVPTVNSGGGNAMFELVSPKLWSCALWLEERPQAFQMQIPTSWSPHWVRDSEAEASLLSFRVVRSCQSCWFSSDLCLMFEMYSAGLLKFLSANKSQLTVSSLEPNPFLQGRGGS